ncbi:CPBP family intramembrane glutamic endopeptidase [Natrialbaceae archaeon GCM10025810]|uniref:CPBP family intramembrane glutamic endopeptidase n=1 Tax=Halovalidus salilacus TaxID=3075124 RepID=UPI00360D4951
MTPGSNRNLLRRVLHGNDGKTRATYRVVLAFVAFFASLLAGQLLISVAGLPVSLPVGAVSTMCSLLVMTVLFYGIWVRRLDRRPLEGYGIALSLSDLGQFVTGLVVTVSGIGLWYLFWIATGWMSVDVVLSYEEGSLALATLLIFVLTVADAAVQELAFLGLIFTNSIEGIQSRITDETTAGIGGLTVTGLFFIAFHFLLGAGAAGFLPPLQAAVFLFVVLVYFVAVYTYTGSLTAAIGAHAALNYSNFLFGWKQLGDTAPYALPEVLVVTGSTPLTDVIGPLPLAGLLLSFGLLALFPRTPVGESDAGRVLPDHS